MGGTRRCRCAPMVRDKEQLTNSVSVNVNSNTLSRFGKIFLLSGLIALCFTNPLLLTWQDRTLLLLGVGFPAAGFWHFVIRSLRVAKQAGEVSIAALILALLGSIAFALLLFGPCSVV